MKPCHPVRSRKYGLKAAPAPVVGLGGLFTIIAPGFSILHSDDFGFERRVSASAIAMLWQLETAAAHCPR